MTSALPRLRATGIQSRMTWPVGTNCRCLTPRGFSRCSTWHRRIPGFHVGKPLIVTTANPPAAESAGEGTQLLWILRTGVAMCFLGHGAFGLITKKAWLPYFAVAGIPESSAWAMMPWIGTMDVAIAFLAF